MVYLINMLWFEIDVTLLMYEKIIYYQIQHHSYILKKINI